MTRELTRVNPFNQLRNMTRAMDQLMYDWPSSPWSMREDVELSGFDTTLPVDVFERGDSIVVKAALPGVDPKDIDVSVNNGILQISAETRTEQDVDEGAYHRREYRYGKFARSLRLPNNVDPAKAKAEFDNGMLRLTIPHTDESKAKSIKIDVR